MYDGANWGGSIQVIQGSLVANLLLNGNGGNVGINNQAPKVALDTNGTIRAMGSQSASGGTGVEISHDGSNGYIQSLTRPTPGWKGLTYNAASHNFSIGNVGINKASPGYPLDITGDCNISGTYRVNGVPLSGGGGGITTQNVVSASRALGTIYQNTSGKPMMVAVTAIAANGGSLIGVTDSASSPTTVVISAQNASATGMNIAVSFWVLPGNYYKVYTATGTATSPIWTEWT